VPGVRTRRRPRRTGRPPQRPTRQGAGRIRGRTVANPGPQPPERRRERVRSRSRLPSTRPGPGSTGRGRCRAREEGPRSDRNRRRIGPDRAGPRARGWDWGTRVLCPRCCAYDVYESVEGGRYGIPPLATWIHRKRMVDIPHGSQNKARETFQDSVNSRKPPMTIFT
jgi:hypothetical protein